MPHLMNCAHMADGWCLNCVGQLHDYADALSAQCVADTPDAERYRWLRDTGAVFTVRAGGCEGDACVLADIGRPAVGLDVAIDAAMAARLTVGAA